MMMPEISIIVPVYKVEKFLIPCLDSIKNQSFQNFEVICVDDGSPDNCGLILDNYAKTDPRFKVIHKKNGGLSSARNAATPFLRAPYTLFLDSDDALHPQALEVIHQYINIINADVFWFDSSTFTGNVPDCEVFDINNLKNIETFCNPFEIYALKKKSDRGKKIKISGVVWNKVYKTQYVKNTPFEEGLSPGEDNLFTFDVMTQINRIAHIPYNLYFYRVNPSSIMNTFNKDKYKVNIRKEVNGYVKLQNKYLHSGISDKKKEAIKRFTATFFLKNVIRFYGKQLRDITVEEAAYIKKAVTSGQFHFKNMKLAHRVQMFYYLKIKPRLFGKNFF